MYFGITPSFIMEFHYLGVYIFSMGNINILIHRRIELVSGNNMFKNEVGFPPIVKKSVTVE